MRRRHRSIIAWAVCVGLLGLVIVADLVSAGWHWSARANVTSVTSDRDCSPPEQKQYLQRLVEFVEAGRTEYAFSWAKSRMLEAAYDAAAMSRDITWIRQTASPACATTARDAALAFLVAMVAAQRHYIGHTGQDDPINEQLLIARDRYQAFVTEIERLTAR